MSRVGKRPIEIPDKVDVDIDGRTIRVKGPLGALERTISEVVDIRIADGEIVVERRDDSRMSRSHQGLTRSLLENMVLGCATGFSRELEISGVGYRSELHGNYLRFDLGFSHAILYELPESVSAKVDSQTAITLTSPNKELLGEVTAKLRGLRPPEPYKGKGIRYKGEIIRRKVGKAGA